MRCRWCGGNSGKGRVKTMYCSQFVTRFGSGMVYATEQGVVRVEIPDLSRKEAVRPAKAPEFAPSELTAHAARFLERYYAGERIDFSAIPVWLGDLPPFRRKVLEASRTLGFGEICSYGQLAQLCGAPRAARAVGGALAANPVPVIIPCHRIMAADGRLTGYSAPGGEKTKMALLKMEGVEFKGGQVVTNQLVMHSAPVQKK